mgnify:CR=1 FL=1
MLKENLMSILAALGEVQGNTKNEEQAEVLETNLHVVSVDLTTKEAEIVIPALELRLTARDIKVSGVFPARAIREVM